MTKPGIGQLGLVLCASLVTAGCEMAASGKVKDAPETGAAAATGADAAAAGGLSQNVRLVERDVEAPNVFQVSDKGLWDGRPSLGGVWVAHSKVKEPERVMIRNPANGKFVVGALFRREFENPGPSLQVSSDAAEALGLLAGQPQVLSVVALKREELPNGGVPADPADPVIGDKVNDDAGKTVQTAKAGTGTGTAAGDAAGNAALASAAVAAAKGAPKAPAGTTTAQGAKPLSGAAPGAVAGTAAMASAAQPEVPVLPNADARSEKKGWWPFGKRKQQAAPAAAQLPEPSVAASVAPGTITAAAIGAGNAGAAPAANAQTGTIAATPASSLSRPYLQIGIFSVEANAEKAAKQMRGAGMTATVKADQSAGKSFWRVIVGPAATETARGVLAAKVKGLGYPDAYAVSR